MTRAQFIAKYPRATEQVIRPNCEPDPRTEPPPPPCLAPGRPKAKKPKRQLVPRTRNAGTWTEAQFWTRLRSCLRRMSLYWKPADIAEKSARIPFKGPRGRKWAFRCVDCGRLFKRSEVHLDHIESCGALTDYSHIGPFLARLLPEDPAAYAIRCKNCHQDKTNAERAAKAAAVSSGPANPQ